MLKRLELVGFKSFAKKTTLDFGQSVVSVVGPNGSGKSNVVESFRFVLGEQSMKSLRGKGGSDLIFKGSKHIPKQSRASVSITFDNSRKIFHISGDNKDSISLDFDEITISREVYADGRNIYKINGTEVRLRDVVEVLASVHIGASGHHIISQGQADRVLTSNPKERREMIEDALGLKVYQYRLRDSEKKLEKTEINLKEVGSLRKEIAPHLRFLKKQVEKIQEAEGLRRELGSLYTIFLSGEEYYVETRTNELAIRREELDQSLLVLREKQKELNQNASTDELLRYKSQISVLDEELRLIEKTKQELSHRLGKTEGMIEFHERAKQRGERETVDSITMSGNDLSSFIETLTSFLDEATQKKDIASMIPFLERIRHHVYSFASRFKKGDTQEVSSAHAAEDDIRELSHVKSHIEQELQRFVKEEEGLRAKISQFEEAMRDYTEKRGDEERKKFDIEMSIRDIENQRQVVDLSLLDVGRLKTSFEEEVKEGYVLVGVDIKNYKNHPLTEDEKIVSFDRVLQERKRKDIERIKIKLEESGVLGGVAEVMKEYEETSERDAFLLRELEDLERSMVEITTLIHELKERLDVEFKQGIEKINVQFKEFFSLMFGGGNAFLSLVVQKGKKKKGDDEEALDETEEEGRIEHGVEINVSLPRKKVRDLHMLSGGERSLTSIALLFAMSQVNPPPFMVLDETDAALDEANSRRYGDMIESLSKYSQLVVVTHNRETMSRADALYGVTLGIDESSKVLSIKFNDAEQYAK